MAIDDKVIRDGHQARQFLDSALFKEVVDEKVRDLTEQVLNLKDWRWWRLHRRRQVLIDEVKAWRGLKSALEFKVTVGKQEENKRRQMP